MKKLKFSSAETPTVGTQAEGAEEETAALSDEDVTKLVGTADACKLEVSYTTSNTISYVTLYLSTCHYILEATEAL